MGVRPGPEQVGGPQPGGAAVAALGPSFGQFLLSLNLLNLQTLCTHSFSRFTKCPGGSDPQRAQPSSWPPEGAWSRSLAGARGGHSPPGTILTRPHARSGRQPWTQASQPCPPVGMSGGWGSGACPSPCPAPRLSHTSAEGLLCHVPAHGLTMLGYQQLTRAPGWGCSESVVFVSRWEPFP